MFCLLRKPFQFLDLFGLYGLRMVFPVLPDHFDRVFQLCVYNGFGEHQLEAVILVLLELGQPQRDIFGLWWCELAE